MRRIITFFLCGLAAEAVYAQTPDTLSVYGEKFDKLQEAVHVEQVKFVERKIDKVVVNVKESAFAQGSNAFELMKKAPGVTIDKDGNVKLNGKAVSVWIDGRPSYVDGKSLEALLKSTNSESIDRFELMEHPSAKYDAAGQGGIINIRTKRNFLQGFNGSAGLGGGAMHFGDVGETAWQQSSWANLAYRTPKTNSFFNIYEGFDSSPFSLEDVTEVQSMGLLQKGRTDFSSSDHSYNVKFGNDWFLNDKNTLGVIVFVPGYRSTFDSKSSLTRTYLSNVPSLESEAVIKNGPSHALRHSLNLNYTHIFDPARSAEMTSNLDYYHNMSQDENTQDEKVRDLQNPSADPTIAVKSMESTQKFDVYSAKVDYQTLVWKKFLMEAGAKWAYSVTDYGSLETGILPINQDLTYREHVAALYASFAGQLSPKWSFKAGLRGEYTNTFGDWKTEDKTTSRSYFDLFPTVFLGFNPSQNLRFSLSYTRRISRPYYAVLNPSKTYIDSKTYTMGNPDILPQYSDNASLTSGFGQYLSLTLMYGYTRNVLNQIPSFNPSDNTQVLTYGNLGTQQLAVLSFNVSALPIAKWLQWTLSANGIRMNTVTPSDIRRSCWSAQGYTDFTFILPKDWKIDLDGYYASPMIVGCYRTHQRWASNIAVKKTLLDGKLVLTMKLDDIFRSESNNLDITDESGNGAVSTLKQNYYSQMLQFDITWNFGRAQSPMRRRKVGDFEEGSRMGSGGGIGK